MILQAGKTSKTELAKLILAQDLFGLWGDELTPACTATLIGSQKWAGDEVAPVSLLVYLRDSVPAAQPLMVSVLSLLHVTGLKSVQSNKICKCAAVVNSGQKHAHCIHHQQQTSLYQEIGHCLRLWVLHWFPS